MVTVKLIGALRAAAKKDVVTLSISSSQPTVQSIVESLVTELGSDFKVAIMGSGRTDPRANVLVLKNGVEISALHGLDTRIEDKDELVLIPIAHGG